MSEKWKVEKMVGGNKLKIAVERIDSCRELTALCKERPVTDYRFDTDDRDPSWTGVANNAEGWKLLNEGYEPVIKKFKSIVNSPSLATDNKFRQKTFAAPVGGYLCIPKMLNNDPNFWIASKKVKTRKSKVINVFVDMTASCAIEPEELQAAAENILVAIISLEKQGYKINLYSCFSSYRDGTADVMAVKIKDSSTTLDLKRMSFSLCHPAFLRVISFDWYAKFPLGTYRDGYGKALAYEYSLEEINNLYSDLFRCRCTTFCVPKVLKENAEYFKDKMLGDAQ